MKIVNKSVQHLLSIDINDHWETPLSDLEDAMKRYNVNPKIDVFASETNHKFPEYYTISDSAFCQQLTKSSFANPMYSDIAKCMNYLYHQHIIHDIDIMVLTYSKTDTNWWHDYVEDKAEVHFIKGRLRFLINGIIPRYCNECKRTFIKEIDFCPDCSLFKPVRLRKNVAPYPSCWIIYRKGKCVR